MRVLKTKLVLLASITLVLSQGTVGSAKLLGLEIPKILPKKDKPQASAKTVSPAAAQTKDLKVEAKPPVNELKAAETPIVSERLRAAAKNLINARKQVEIARAHLRAAEAEYKVAKIEREAIALRQAANGMAVAAVKEVSPAKPDTGELVNERIEAPASAVSTGELMPTPAKPAMAPAPGWNKPSPEEVSIDDLDLP